MGGNSSKNFLLTPTARQVVAARSRAPAESVVAAVTESSSSVAAGRKVIERGSTDLSQDAEGKADTNPEILSEMSKWHFIESNDDQDILRLVAEKKKTMASLIRMAADDSTLPGRDIPMGLLSGEELSAALLLLRDVEGRTLKEARRDFLSELEAYGVSEELAISIALSAKVPLVEVEEEDVSVAR